MERKAHTDKFTEVEDRYAGYTVYDQHYEKIGNVDDLFLDESDQPEYIGVKMGFLGTRTTLIPFQMARANDTRQTIKVAADKEKLRNGPTFDDEREITPEFEKEVYSYYGLHRASTTQESPTYGAYYAEQSTQTTVANPTDMSDEDEVRVQRTEEELRSGPRTQGWRNKGQKARENRPRAHRGPHKARRDKRRTGASLGRGFRGRDR